MADKKKSDDKPVLDKRLIERMIQKGQLTRGDVEKHLQSLPDLADKAENIAPIVYPNQG